LCCLSTRPLEGKGWCHVKNWTNIRWMNGVESGRVGFTQIRKDKKKKTEKLGQSRLAIDWMNGPANESMNECWNEWTVTRFGFADNLPRLQDSAKRPPSVIWFTSFNFFFLLFISFAFWKEFTWATKCWPDVRLRFFYLPALSLLRLSRSRLIILLKQISTLKLITLMKLCLSLCLLSGLFSTSLSLVVSTYFIASGFFGLVRTFCCRNFRCICSKISA